MSLTLFPDEFERAHRKGIAKVSGVGFGFTLIRRPVLKQVGNFRRVSIDMGGNAAPDTEFARDCQRLGIEQWANFNVKCGHIKPDGTVLWPPYTEGKTGNMGYEEVRFIALQSFNGNVGGQLKHFNAGDLYDLPANDEVTDFIRAGFLQYLEPVKVKEPVEETVKPVRKRKTTTRKKAAAQESD